MSIISSFLEDDTNRYWFGSIVSLACMLIAYGASKLIADSPRLRTVLALVACGWVLQMGAYSAPRDAHDLANLASDLVSFVHVFAGVLLIEELDSKLTRTIVSVLQGAAFWLLLALLLPHRQEFHAILNQSPLGAHQIDQMTSLALSVASYVAIGFGAWSVSRGGFVFSVLAGSLVLYAGLNCIRLLELWSADPAAIPRLGSSMVVAFAIAKLVMTISLSLIVVMAAQRSAKSLPSSSLPRAA